jgi:hypothetical protein
LLPALPQSTLKLLRPWRVAESRPDPRQTTRDASDSRPRFGRIGRVDDLDTDTEEARCSEY